MKNIISALPSSLFTSSYQPLPLILASAVCGILTDRFLVTSAAFWLFLIFVTITGWCILRYRQRHLAAGIGIYLLCFTSFGFRHHDYYYRFAENDIGNFAQKDEQPVAVIGTVAEMPRYYPKPPDDAGQVFESSDRTNLTIFATKLRDGSTWIPVSGKAAMNSNGDLRNLHIGDSVQIFGNLYKPVPPQNPGDYDSAAVLQGQRIRAALFCGDKNAVTLMHQNSYGVTTALLRILETLRRTGIANLERCLSPQTLPLAEGMIFGVRQGVDEEVTQSLLETGTIHILAISGLHTALAAGIAAFFLRLCKVPRRTTAFITIMLVFLYLFVTDVRTPAIRATVLITVTGIAVLTNRQTLPVNLLSAAALIVLMLNPAELFQFGAQLSFLAVGCFIWVPVIQEKRRKTEAAEKIVYPFCRRIAGNTARLFLVSFTIWLITMPMILERIHLFTPVAVLVNPLMWLPLSASMLFGFLTALFGQVPYIGYAAGCLADVSFQSLLALITCFQQLGGHYYLPGPPVWWNPVFYAVFCFLTFLPVKRPRRSVLCILAALWIAAGLVSGYVRCYVRQSEDQLTLAVYAVGHGNCILITTPQNKLILCDAGRITNPQFAADVLSRAVWRSGKTHIDMIIVTHPDSDHFNAISRLLDRFSVGTVLVSPYCNNPNPSTREQTAWNLLQERLKAQEIPQRIIGSGDNLKEYGLPHSQILHPPKTVFPQYSETNDASIVLRFEHCGKSIMLTGDLDGNEPAPFLLTEPVHTDTVMIPHHGGKSNQTKRLLDWATPDILLFSAGKMTYRKKAMDEYRRQGFEVHNTFEDGAVILNYQR
ncbi:MAG: ComEC/Rec2 family competence protein [Planctomycetaceae bacterium]|jgi:competence protein ComEC|nr:ComEC/Rec2 family competence protein [Planctomycetaceae bacterium]